MIVLKSERSFSSSEVTVRICRLRGSFPVSMECTWSLVTESVSLCRTVIDLLVTLSSWIPCGTEKILNICKKRYLKEITGDNLKW